MSTLFLCFVYNSTTWSDQSTQGYDKPMDELTTSVIKKKKNYQISENQSPSAFSKTLIQILPCHTYT